MNKLLIIGLCVGILSGCATYPSAGSQPRALQIGAMQPYCLFFCFATSTAMENEKSTGNFAPSNSVSNKASQSLSLPGSSE